MKPVAATTLLCLVWPTLAFAQADPMLEGDPVDSGGAILELQPEVPRIEAGPDEDLGTADDVVDFGTLGDVDLVVRTGLTSFVGPIPVTAPGRGAVPQVRAGPNGIPIPFVVATSDGSGSPGNPVVSPAVEGNPVLVVAFADLDGDGYVGVTSLDGDPNDASTEEAELNFVGRAFAIVQNGQAGGQLFVHLGAPATQPVRVILSAAAYTGATDPGFFGGAVPTGPAVLSNLPFFPRLDPGDIIEGSAPNFASSGSRVGVEVEDEFTPDPTAAYGESFSIETDGSIASVDVADVRSGSHLDFSFVREADPATYDEGSDGPLLPGEDGAGARILVELIPESSATGALRVVPTDALGNIVSLAAPTAVRVVASAGLEIPSPDADGDPTGETLILSGAAGASLTLTGSGQPVVEPVPEPEAGTLAVAALAALALVVTNRRKPVQGPR